MRLKPFAGFRREPCGMMRLGANIAPTCKNSANTPHSRDDAERQYREQRECLQRGDAKSRNAVGDDRSTSVHAKSSKPPIRSANDAAKTASTNATRAVVIV